MKSEPNEATESDNRYRSSSWAHLHLWQIQPLRDALVFAGVFGILYLGYVLSIVTVPVLLALAFAYLFEPLVQRMTRTGRVGRARVAASIIVLSFMLVGVPTIIGVTYSIMQGLRYSQQVIRSIDVVTQSVRAPQREDLRASVSLRSHAWLFIRDYIVTEREKAANAVARERADHGLPPVQPDGTSASPSGETPATAGTGVAIKDTAAPASEGPPVATHVEHSPPTIDSSVDDEPSDLFKLLEFTRAFLQQHSNEIGRNLLQAGGGAVNALLAVALSLGKVVSTAALTAFFFFFFSTSYGKVLSFWESLLPEHKKGRVLGLVQQMDAVISGFIRGRLIICATMIGVYTVGYSLIGVPAAWFAGVVVGVLTLIPYAAGVGVPVTMLFMWLEPIDGFRGTWWWTLASPVLILAIAQGFDDYLLTPRIQGKTTNMDMPTILFASIAGGALAGFYGLLIAIPAAACIKILLREIFWPRFRAWATGMAEDMLPISKE
jgi:predicted PurR-regulated permease PerM